MYFIPVYGMYVYNTCTYIMHASYYSASINGYAIYVSKLSRDSLTIFKWLLN